MVAAEPEEEEQEGDKGEDEEDGEVEPIEFPAFPLCHKREGGDGDEEEPHDEGGGDAVGKRCAVVGEDLMHGGGERRAVGEAEGVVLGHHLCGDEAKLSGGDGAVAACAEQDVGAQLPPRHGGVVAVEEVAVCGPANGARRADMAVGVESGVDHVVDASGTVVAEEVVAIVLVLRFCIIGEGGVEA